MNESPKRQFLVMVAESHQDKLKAVKKSLQSAGMSGISVLAETGVITGEIEPEKQSQLEAIPGVKYVEPSQSYQLPSPDAEIQ